MTDPPVPTHHPLTAARDRWLAALVAAGRSRAYLYKCQLASNSFIAALPADTADLATVTPGDCRAWLTALRARGLAHNTVCTHEANVRSWCAWAVREGDLTASPWARIPAGKPVETVTAVPTPADVQRVIDAVLAPNPDGRRALPGARPRRQVWRRRRDAALIAVLLDTGLRASELLALTRADIDEPGHAIHVRGKGGVERLVRISPAVARAVGSYLRAYERAQGLLAPDDRLWRNQYGAPLAASSLRDAVAAAGEAAGLPNPLHPHLLRHAFAAGFLDAGGRWEQLQLLIGHTKAETTRRYTRHHERERALAAHALYSPARGLRVAPARPARQTETHKEPHE